MGLQDRDYMHERRERPFSAPTERDTPTWLILVLLGLTAYALYQAYERWWLPRAGSGTAAPPPPAAAQPPRPAESLSAPAGWTRCDIGGRVLYTDGPCPSGAASVLTEPIPPAQAASAPTITLYHCKAYDGRTFWANSHCNQHQALVDRLVNVPAHLPFDQQVELANGQRLAAQQAVQAPQVAIVTAPGQAADSKVHECRYLNDRVQYLDALARQPQSAPVQDWIRGQRQSARDQQFRLHC